MSTPFEFFRRHQKVALAAITGAAVLSFVVFDSTNQGTLSPTGLAVLVIGCCSLVGWIWGASDGKSSENAIFGGVLGLAMTLTATFLGRPPAAISASTGNITRDDLDELHRQRNLANRMVNLVYYGANPNAGFMAQFMLPRFMFGYGLPDPTDDVLVTELLNREADELGIVVTDDAAMNFLMEVAGKDRDGKDQLTQEVFSNAIKQVAAGIPGAKEDTIFDALRHEMRARQSLQILYGGNRTTPEDVWDLHRKLSVRESGHVVGLPVADFVNKDDKPTDAELQQIFESYKANSPNSTPEGKLEEGRPGLYLPRRVRLAYVEPVYEEIEKQVGEITEEEIKARYDEQYNRPMPDLGPHGELTFPDMPLLPKSPKAPAETPAAEGDKPAAPAEGAKPAEGEKPADAVKPADGEKPAAEGDKPAPEAKPEPAAPEAKPTDPAAKPEGSSSRVRASQLQPVVLIQDQPATGEEAPAAEAKPAADTPATEKPAEAAPAADAPAAPATPAAEGDKPAAPATDAKPEEKPAAPAGEKKPEGESGAGDKPADAPLTVPAVESMPEDNDPAPPVSKVRPLDETLRQQIRDDLLREKVRPLMEEKINAARDYMNELHLGIAEYLDYENAPAGKKPELSKNAISPENAAKQLKEYAEKHGMLYAETPLLTLPELLKSEDHPLGGALTGKQSRVVDTVNQSQKNDLYSAYTAFNIDQKGSYAFWKIEDVSAHIPANLDEPGIKEQATQIWQTLKARPLAEKRSQELVALISKSDKPMAETLADQTVTGDKDKSLFVTVKATGEFSWLQRSMTPQQFGGDNSPHLGALDGVEGAGEGFMSKVFDGMKPGDTAVVPNFDRSIVYVIQIDNRTPATEAEVEVMRNQFLTSQGELMPFAARQVQALDGYFADRLFVKHGVKMAKADADSGK